MLKFVRYTAPNAEMVEIGQADRFVLKDLKGDSYEYGPGRNIKDDLVVLYGFKEPLPTVSQMMKNNNLLGNFAPSKEVANLQIIIAALVHQMGGSVIIQPTEVEDAVNNFTLTNMHDKDFGFLVLKTEENNK